MRNGLGSGALMINTNQALYLSDVLQQDRRGTKCLVAFCFLVLLACASGCGKDNGTTTTKDNGTTTTKDSEVDRLITQLGDPEFTRREEASRRLAEIGEPALDALYEAARSDDAEVRSRAQNLVQKLEERFRTSELIKWDCRCGFVN